MQIHQKRSKTVLYIVIFCAMTLAVAGILAYLKPRQSHAPRAEQSTDTPRQAPEKTTSQPTTIQLGTSRITPLQEDYTHDNSLWRLVNKKNPLTDPNYTPAELTKAPIAVRPGLREDEQSLRTILVPELRAMVAEAAQDGATLTLGSGYRSPELQKFFFDNYAARDGVEAASKYSALPGQSEHQTGLSLDFAAGNMSCYLEQCFSGTPEGTWLAVHAHEYGFVMRYPEGKDNITGYQFEPWHYRYVGKDLAVALHTNNLLLEDVWPQLLQARSPQ